jgi:hypothetical protein
MTTYLRVWWIPQVPGKPFVVPINTVDEGVKLCEVLADYDLFQFENRIKPDYANAGGIEYMDDTGEWFSVDVDDEDDLASLRELIGESK